MTGLWMWALPDWVEWCRCWDLKWAGVRIYDVPDSELRPVNIWTGERL